MMHPEEAGIRDEMAKATVAYGPPDWPRWNAARLVLADWLEDHRRPAEAAMTRAEWKIGTREIYSTRTHLCPNPLIIEYWWVVAPNWFKGLYDPNRKILGKDQGSIFGAHNANHVLHFAPGILKCLEITNNNVRFTAVASRAGRPVRKDTVQVKHGFAALFYEGE